MAELREILDGLRLARSRGSDAVLATVVRVSGSTYRRPGARMLITRDGVRVGAVSGGCLEQEVARRAWWLTDTHDAALAVYDTRSSEEAAWEFGLGCQGVVQVLLERVPAATPTPHLAFIESHLTLRLPCVVARVIEAESGSAAVGDFVALGAPGASTGRSESHAADSDFTGEISNLADAELRRRIAIEAQHVWSTGISKSVNFPTQLGAVRVFVEYVAPPVSLLVCGAGYDALPVVKLAKQLGWDATLLDLRATTATPTRFTAADRILTSLGDLDRIGSESRRAAAVVMTHNYADDLAILPKLLNAPQFAYIGLLGPRSRSDALLADVAASGVRLDESALARVYAPVGLAIGAETAEQIALAIAAEIQAALAGHKAGFLRDNPGPIHRPQDNSDEPIASEASGQSVSCPIQPA
ncbi:MAG: XdhC family protein [Phycisphaerae bacterium]